MSPQTKDIKYIEIQFFASVGKPNIKVELVDTMTRRQALQIAGIIQEANPSEVFCVKSWTTNNTWI